jgi:hypothetical protein
MKIHLLDFQNLTGKLKGRASLLLEYIEKVESVGRYMQHIQHFPGGTYQDRQRKREEQRFASGHNTKKDWCKRSLAKQLSSDNGSQRKGSYFPKCLALVFFVGPKLNDRSFFNHTCRLTRILRLILVTTSLARNSEEFGAPNLMYRECFLRIQSC